MHSTLSAVIFMLCLLTFPRLSAQEPGSFEGSRAARFAVGPDVNHYVWPCGPKQSAKVVAQPLAGLPGLCWAVRAAKITIVSGKAQVSPYLVGTLYISSTDLQLKAGTPNEVPAFQSPVSAIRIEYDPRSQSAVFGNQREAYRFVLLNTCSHCTSGTAPPALDPAKLEAEYGLLVDSLKSFDAVAKRIARVVSMVRVEVMPENQPVLSDPAGAMRLYSTLNERLAEGSSEPARSCLQSYARYQECAAGSSPTACGHPPACTAVFNVDPNDLMTYKASVCYSRSRECATLAPDWTEVFERQDRERLAHPPTALKIVPETSEQKAARLALVNQQVCSVTHSYNMAQMNHMTRGVSTLLAPSVDVGGVIHLSASDAHTLTVVPPVYPLVARAAKVEGVVILRALISKQGTVTDLAVVSGPDLLRSAALEAVRQWTYKPYLLDGAPVEVQTTVTVNFRIGSAPPLPAPTADLN